ncbi:hypothetical protein Tco_1149304 [Tanacetum coccineum]
MQIGGDPVDHMTTVAKLVTLVSDTLVDQSYVQDGSGLTNCFLDAISGVRLYCQNSTSEEYVPSYALSWKPCQGDSLNLPDHRIHKDGDGDALFQLKSDSLPHAHAQTTKTYNTYRDSRIMKAQELKTKTSAQTLI